MKKSKLPLRILVALAVLFFTVSALAAGPLRIEPVRLDCGVVDEGVPAVMKATVENTGTQDVHILNVRTN